MDTAGIGKPYFRSRNKVLQDYETGNSQFETADWSDTVIAAVRG